MGQNRYLYQVSSLFMDDEWAQVVSRLSSELPIGCRLWVYCDLNLSDSYGRRVREMFSLHILLRRCGQMMIVSVKISLRR